ncbi:MAG TPA: sulfotransferase domain-containing protein [Candidatus Aquilonibacter sp.]|nr:sulfotransferase domain-containing protein [Candidatus Aquilonibacter sp.]
MLTLRKVRHTIARSPVHGPLAWIRHRGVRPADVFVASYPRSGNTWLRFMLYEILVGQSSSFVNIRQLVPDIGQQDAASPLLAQGGRLIKTHEPYRREYKKAIYLVRDARDVALSEFAYQKALGVIPDDFELYLQRFLRGRVNPFGSWVEHVNSWMKAKDDEDAEILLVHYDKLRRDPEESLAAMMEFLAVTVERQTIQRAISNNSLKKMQEKEKANPQKASAKGRFVREGSVGGWSQAFTPAQALVFEQHTGTVLQRLGYPVGSTEYAAV